MSDQATRLTSKPQGGDEAPDLSVYLAARQVELVVLDGPHKGARYPVRLPSVRIGRSRSCQLVFDEETISREHAAIDYRDGRFFLRDLGSSNGCVIDGETIHAHELQHGDRFSLGKLLLQFLDEEREHAPETHVLSDS